jgi:hypothetical protein
MFVSITFPSTQHTPVPYTTVVSVSGHKTVPQTRRQFSTGSTLFPAVSQSFLSSVFCTIQDVCSTLLLSSSIILFSFLAITSNDIHARLNGLKCSVPKCEFDLGFGWVVAAAVVWVRVWGFWAGPGLVWMGCVVFATALLWGGRLLAAGHQSSSAVSRC